MGGQLFPGRRLNGFFAPPEFFTIIGLDTDDGPEHPLYDPRGRDPVDAKLRALAEDIIAIGYIQPIKIRKNGEAAEVIAGRRRVRAGRLANEMLAKKKREPIEVPFIVHRSNDDAALLGIGISENEHRKGDDVIVKAAKAARLADLGRDDETIGARFGVTAATVRLWISLLDLSKKVQKAIASGAISATAAGKLAKLSRAEQDAALVDLVPADGRRVTVRDAADAAAGRSPTKRAKRPPLSLLRKLSGHPFMQGELREALLWMVGESETPPHNIAAALKNIEEGGG